MRSVGTLSNENQARIFAQYLTSQGIASSCEVSFEPANGYMSYQVWIHDEDQLGIAAAAFEEFQKKPSDPKFVPPPLAGSEPAPVEQKIPPRRFGIHLTLFFLSACIFIFLLNTLQELSLRKEGIADKEMGITPIQALLMYDLPPHFEIEMKAETLQTTPYWRGIYDWVVEKIRGEPTSLSEGPLFIRLRQGEFWRLFTPCVLHRDLLHILFNMLWLWVLGRPIEQRIGPFRTLLLTLFTGVGSNTVQYFMSGPFFIGYSGIVTGLAGFTWMRERIAPWEGYPLNRSTILFLLLFIGAILVLQIAAFFIQILTSSQFAPNIANAAHIAGALFGALLGRFPSFAQRVHR